MPPRPLQLALGARPTRSTHRTCVRGRAVGADGNRYCHPTTHGPLMHSVRACACACACACVAMQTSAWDETSP